MPKGRDQKKEKRFPHEETWLRNFVGYHATGAVTRFSERDLGGVSLTRIVGAIAAGTVIDADKGDGAGTVCLIEYMEEEGAIVLVKVRFSSSEETLEILAAEERKETNYEPDHAA